MTSFLRMEIEHNKKDIAIHLDTYVLKTLDEYKMAVSKFLKPKKVPMQPGLVPEQEDSFVGMETSTVKVHRR
jgi:hypothetical protein